MRTTKKWGESSPGPHHKPILILKSVELPAAKTAMDKDGNKWRMKQLSLCGDVNQHKDASCWSNTNTTQEATSHTRDQILRTILVWRQGPCQSYGFFTTSHSIRRRRDGSNIHWHQQRQKTKPYVHAQSPSKITRLAPKIGSCRNSKPAKFLVLWNTRFTRQQLLCPVKQRKWRGRLRLWSFQSSSDCLYQPTWSIASDWFINHNEIMGTRIMVSNRLDMAKSCVKLRLGTFRRLMGPIRRPQNGDVLGLRDQVTLVTFTG